MFIDIYSSILIIGALSLNKPGTQILRKPAREASGIGMVNCRLEFRLLRVKWTPLYTYRDGPAMSTLYGKLAIKRSFETSSFQWSEKFKMMLFYI